MPHIRTVSPRHAGGETAEVYGLMRSIGGTAQVANIVQLFSLRPASMRRMLRSWELALWSGDEPRRNRELVAAAVARFAECHY